MAALPQMNRTMRTKEVSADSPLCLPARSRLCQAWDFFQSADGLVTFEPAPGRSARRRSNRFGVSRSEPHGRHAEYHGASLKPGVHYRLPEAGPLYDYTQLVEGNCPVCCSDPPSLLAMKWLPRAMHSQYEVRERPAAASVLPSLVCGCGPAEQHYLYSVLSSTHPSMHDFLNLTAVPKHIIAVATFPLRALPQAFLNVTAAAESGDEISQAALPLFNTTALMEEMSVYQLARYNGGRLRLRYRYSDATVNCTNCEVPSRTRILLRLAFT